MRVIGSGFGRTGTLSTKVALERLGFGPCHHMEEVLKHPSQVRRWHDVAASKPVDLQRLFTGYESMVDFPGSVVYRELMDVYPDAKVLHTVRDPQRWYDSTAETIATSRDLFPEWIQRRAPVRLYLEMVDGLVWDGLFDGRFDDRSHAIDVYERWTEDVVATVPADRLLVFGVSDGWEPLCDFLGVGVPDEPFPHLNDRKSMLRKFAVIRHGTRMLPAVAAAGVAGAAGLLARRRLR